jgi:hypothetical protein
MRVRVRVRLRAARARACVRASVVRAGPREQARGAKPDADAGGVLYCVATGSVATCA